MQWSENGRKSRWLGTSARKLSVIGENIKQDRCILQDDTQHQQKCQKVATSAKRCIRWMRGNFLMNKTDILKRRTNYCSDLYKQQLDKQTPHRPWGSAGLKMPIYVHFYRRGIFNFDSKVGQTDLFLVCDDGSLVGLCMQDCKSVCTSVTICATLVDQKLDFYIMTLCDLQE